MSKTLIILCFIFAFWLYCKIVDSNAENKKNGLTDGDLKNGEFIDGNKSNKSYASASGTYDNKVTITTNKPSVNFSNIYLPNMNTEKK